MKQGIHPEYKEINVIWTDGTITKTRSTYAKSDLRLDIDPTTHPAWTGGTAKISETGRLAKFKSRYGQAAGKISEDKKSA
jgi:large subunit ribosomal protein L31